MKPQKYIIRQKRYWHVRIRITYDDKVTKCFNFDKHDGVKNALAYAVIWRNQVLKKHGLLERLNSVYSPDYFARRSNRIIGIHRNGNNWVARYSVKGKEFKKGFSINKYGDKGAYIKACSVRRKHCGKLRLNNRRLMP